MAIQGNPGELGNTSRQFLGLSGVMDSAHSGIGSAFGALTDWQGAGASQAGAAAQAVQSNVDKARSSLTAAHQALLQYQSEVEQAQQGWDRADNEELQLKAELAGVRAQLASAQANLAQIQNENAAAEQAYADASVEAQFHSSSSFSLTASPFGTVAPPSLLPTGAVQAQIAQFQQKIQHLEDEIKTREKWKQEYETRARQASDKVTADLHEAEQLWPAAGYGNWSTNGWTARACLVGFNPPPPPSHGGNGLMGIVITAGTMIATIPLDETGAGEAIDAGVASAELGAEGASIAADGAAASTAAADAGAGNVVEFQAGQTVWRADMRPAEDVFKNGVGHVENSGATPDVPGLQSQVGGSGSSAAIKTYSTTTDPAVARFFAGEDSIGPAYKNVYEITAPSGGVDVAATLTQAGAGPGTSGLESEIAFTHIPGENIVGAHLPDGSFLPNPNYAGGG
jgi:hypothetical protein